MDLKISSHKSLIRQYVIVGTFASLLIVSIEYLVKFGGEDEQLLIPLFVRGFIAGLLITLSAAIFEIKAQNLFMQRPFSFIVLVRSLFYCLLISFWLAIINAIWQMILRDFSFLEGLQDYLTDEMYPINLLSIFLLLVLITGAYQINSLHKKGEILKFILGQYHQPREVARIFCFIDLKGSTTIAEQLGHYRYANFLKDYYSDISDALRKTNAEIYQYVGDEIVLSWPLAAGLKNINAIHCFFLMKQIMEGQREKYLNKYGVCPDFRAGIHGGQVMVTWIGEIKKEIVFIGDVLNTSARIQEDCKRLKSEFLISEELLDQFKGLEEIHSTFLGESVPRGKAKKVKLYSLSMKRA